MPDIFSALTLGPYELANRIFMAPCTRCRADADLAPHALNAEYYAQRASAGLIISEATQISPQGMGYPATPGMYSEKQVAGWKLVTSAVHGRGGRIYAQLWHTGRMSHPDFQPGGELPVAPSAVGLEGKVRTPDGTQKDRVVPRALEIPEIRSIIEDYRHAAACALRAGFDGVELHGANGYLPDQFLRDGTNRRTDEYGGPIANRARFMLEATEALCDVWGAARVGVRLSPSGSYHGMSDSAPRETFAFVLRELSKLGVGYAHVMEKLASSPPPADDIPASYFRPMFDGVLIANSGFTFEKAQTYLKEGWANAVAFGVPFIANPDLPARFALMSRGAAVSLNTPDPATFYSAGPQGYTDYPMLSKPGHGA